VIFNYSIQIYGIINILISIGYLIAQLISAS